MFLVNIVFFADTGLDVGLLNAFQHSHVQLPISGHERDMKLRCRLRGSGAVAFAKPLCRCPPASSLPLALRCRLASPIPMTLHLTTKDLDWAQALFAKGWDWARIGDAIQNNCYAEPTPSIDNRWHALADVVRRRSGPERRGQPKKITRFLPADRNCLTVARFCRPTGKSAAL